MFNFPTKYLETVDASKWKTDKTVDKNEVCWLPILTITFDFAPNRIIGITDTGYWTAQWSNGNIEIISERDKCFNLLVCLEKDRGHFFDLLKKAITRQNIRLELNMTFPAIELIKFTLQSGTPWATNAALWLREDDIDKELEELINQFIDNRNYSQQARHQAFKVLKRWQKNS